MLVLTLECAPPKLVGYCSSWALQIATGVYVANLPAAQREKIWETIIKWADPDTRVVMVWASSRTEQGIDFRKLGTPRRNVVEREGLLISSWIPRPDTDLATPEQIP